VIWRRHAASVIQKLNAIIPNGPVVPFTVSIHLPPGPAIGDGAPGHGR